MRLVGSRWCEKAEPQAEGKIARAPGPHTRGGRSSWELEGPTVSGPVNDTRGRLGPRTGPVSLLLTVESQRPGFCRTQRPSVFQAQPRLLSFYVTGLLGSVVHRAVLG